MYSILLTVFTSITLNIFGMYYTVQDNSIYCNTADTEYHVISEEYETVVCHWDNNGDDGGGTLVFLIPPRNIEMFISCIAYGNKTTCPEPSYHYSDRDVNIIDLSIKSSSDFLSGIDGF